MDSLLVVSLSVHQREHDCPDILQECGGRVCCLLLFWWSGDLEVVVTWSAQERWLFHIKCEGAGDFRYSHHLRVWRLKIQKF